MHIEKRLSAWNRLEKLHSVCGLCGKNLIYAVKGSIYWSQYTMQVWKIAYICLYKRLWAWNSTEIIRIGKIESAYPCQQCKQYQKCQQCKQRIERCYPHLWRYFLLCREGWRQWWPFSPILEPLWKMCKGQKQWGLVAQYARSHQLQLRQDEQNYESKMENVRKCQYIWLISFFEFQVSFLF